MLFFMPRAAVELLMKLEILFNELRKTRRDVRVRRLGMSRTEVKIFGLAGKILADLI